MRLGVFDVHTPFVEGVPLLRYSAHRLPGCARPPDRPPETCRGSAVSYGRSAYNKRKMTSRRIPKFLNRDRALLRIKNLRPFSGWRHAFRDPRGQLHSWQLSISSEPSIKSEQLWATPGQPQDETIRNAKKRIERVEMQDWQGFPDGLVSAGFS